MTKALLFLFFASYFLLFGCSSVRTSHALSSNRGRTEIVAAPTRVNNESQRKSPLIVNQTPVPGVDDLAAAPQTHDQVNMYASSLAKAGNWLSLLSLYETAIQTPATSTQSEYYYNRSTEIIDSRLSVEDLQSFTTRSKTTRLRSAAWYRLGELSLEQRDFDGARTYFGRCLAIIEEPSLSERARQVLEQLESLRRVEAKTIGVVLPMTGKHSAISQKILRGIELSLGLIRVSGDPESL